MKRPITNRRQFITQSTMSLTALSLLKSQKQSYAGSTQASTKTGPQHYICETCGTQYPASATPPVACLICTDDRQYIGAQGQSWTTLDTMGAGGFRNLIQEQEPGLWTIHTEPKVGIGQRAFLLRTPSGNILWDCITYLDDDTIATIKQLGGISRIAISHPHYYSTMVEWSRAFGAKILLHESDREYVVRGEDRVTFWSGATFDLGHDLTLINVGGHFPGSQNLHWPGGAEGRGVLFTGDLPHVVADPNWVSFMYSYPNFVPLNPPAIRQVLDRLAPFGYDRIYGAFWPGIIKQDAAAVVKRSAERYLRHMEG